MKKKLILRLAIICLISFSINIEVSAKDSPFTVINGLTYYIDPATGQMASGITEVDGKMYFFGINTKKMMKGWINYNGLTYYTNPETGELAHLWTEIDGKTYFFGIRTYKLMKGFLYLDDGTYYLDPNTGERKTGMIEINGSYYYFDPENGKMVTGLKEIDGLTYYFNPETGKRASGITEVDGKMYFFGITKGKMMKGWINYNGLTYYTNPETGELAHLWTEIDGKTYFFGIKTYKLMKGFLYLDDGTYYLDPNSGVICTGWIHNGNSIYYFDSETKKAITGTHEIDGMSYTFSSDGKLSGGFYEVEGKTYYLKNDGTYITGWAIVTGQKCYFNSNGVLIARNVQKFIDVSAHQGNINWGDVKNLGIVDGAMIRAVYRGWGSEGILREDTYFYQNYRNAKAQGLSLGIYVFSQAVNTNEAIDEANLAINMAKIAGMNNGIIAFDSEFANTAHSGRADGLSKYDRTTVAKAFLDAVRNAGYTPMLYASTSFLYNNLDMSRLSDVKVWVAQWSNSVTYTGNYSMWQYTSSGSVPGISGNVDMDIKYN